MPHNWLQRTVFHETMQKVKRREWLWALLICTLTACSNMKEITVELTVPDTTWTLAIDEVHRMENELWVIARVSQNPDQMGAQVISTLRASLQLDAPDLPVKYFVMGKTWAWENTEPYTFIKDLKQIEDDLNYGELIYKAGNPGI